MSGSITDAISARLDTAGAAAREQDLYAGAGTDFYERLVGCDRAEIREVLALARNTAGPILDVAAGGGRLTVPLVRTGRRVTAIDLSDDMLAHLRRALPDEAGLECAVADMRDFSLERRYGLVVIGATSITLLDRPGRSRLYASVQRHLAVDGVFAFTVATGASAASLAVPRDEEISVPGPGGDETYVFSQQMEEDGAARLVNWVRASDIADGREVTVFTSRLRVLSPEVLSDELVDAGFAAPEISPIRAHRGVDIVLLKTVCAARRGGVRDDASS
ncbi:MULTISPECIES: daptide-type RiPP biosynthesis methyltransferase [unclassified Microbacterium]|uniref:daptide-type RiPP biosynthesis methyltransferase n=1 Tax=unclassified Microbacterium TaxID=2609290 RepID=UPI000EA88D68|nr:MULTISPECIES: daptide-type RiPP biosynthesis methyltransferase [unclassified Microbacterium]MBT2483254.1 class I SAM-dependent methyltransferase [Microbacterium sp. ISL-108]RKN66297.1 class I SAM-dependent methyltransferase [Microbacterium sp. CGR2]